MVKHFQVAEGESIGAAVQSQQSASVPVHQQQQRAAKFFAASQGGAARAVDTQEDNDWQDF